MGIRRLPAADNDYADMNAAGREQKVVGQNPEPLAYVECRQQRRDAGRQVKPGQKVVEEFGEPDSAIHKFDRGIDAVAIIGEINLP